VDRHATAAASRDKKIDEASVSTGDTNLRSSPLTHPFVPKRQHTGSFRIGSIVALHHPFDGPPQVVVFGACKVPPQKFGDCQVVVEFL
jgi:hypothetical protein